MKRNGKGVKDMVIPIKEITEADLHNPEYQRVDPQAVLQWIAANRTEIDTNMHEDEYEYDAIPE